MNVTIKALRAAGVSDTQILDLIEIMEEERLAKGRARTAKCRNLKGNGDVGNVTHVTDVTSVTSPPPKKVPPGPPSKNTPYPTLPFSNENGADQTLSMNVFEDFWSAFPKRLGSNPKKPAKARFEAALRDGADPQDLIAAAHRLAAQHPVPSVYVPMTVTWLNQERWKDEATGPPAENIVRFRTMEEVLAEVEARNAGRAEGL